MVDRLFADDELAALYDAFPTARPEAAPQRGETWTRCD